MGIFYSNELEAMVSKAALNLMKQTQNVFVADQRQKVESLTMLNERTGIYNTGVHDLAVYLLNLIKQAEGDGNHNDD